MTFVTQIIVFCFYFHFTRCANFFFYLILGEGLVVDIYENISENM